MKYRLSILAFFIVYVCSAQSRGFLPSVITDLESYNKTMTILEKLFEYKPTKETLYRICTESFIKSNHFRDFSNAIASNSVNIGYTTEKIQKSFTLNQSRNTLTVLFNRDKNFFWHIDDAYITNKRGKNIYFEKKGFKPLAAEFNFTDFQDIILNKSFPSYAGLAPYGKLPVQFLKENKIDINEEATLFIENVIIHDEKQIQGLYVLKLTNSSKLKNDKRGWLIDDFIPMENYVEKSLFIDYLLGDTSKYNLKKKSNYFYSFDNFVFTSTEDAKTKGVLQITGKTVNVRERNNVKSKKIGVVKKDQQYTFLRKSEPTTLEIQGKKVKHVWYEIEFNDSMKGWVFGFFIKEL
ncbi:MAG: SH3 domain-containing protein [Bacteroidota bacterium]